MVISAIDAITAINQVRGDSLVVSTMTPTRYWASVSDKPDLDLPVFGSMGKASSVALGIALARPDRKVIVLEGDGSLLMNLGGLVTVAGQQPHNLVHFVFEDGIYSTTGGQPIPGAGMFDLVGIATSAGYSHCWMFDELEDFIGQLDHVLDAQGPVFVCLKVVHIGGVPEFNMGKNIGVTKEAIQRVKRALEELY